MRRIAAIMVVVTVLLFARAQAAELDGAMLARQGNGHGVVACMACHGEDGTGQAAAGFPRLAGLPAAYLLKQLDNFADGSRGNATMRPVASGLSDAEREALAIYYSKLPLTPTTVSMTAMGDAPSAQILATRGRWSNGLPACEQCHGPDGVGVGDHFPPLAGQSALYISNELHAWQQGARHNDPLQLMQSVAGKLNDADIAAISAWYAAQSPPPKATQP